MGLNNVELERKKNILQLCYDNLEEIKGNNFIVKVDDKYGIIDIDNNFIFKLTPNKIYKRDDSVLIRHNAITSLINQDTMQIEYIDSESYLEAHGNIAIVSYGFDNHAVLGSDGSYLLPPIYRRIIYNGKTADGHSLWVKTTEGNTFCTKISEDGRRSKFLDIKDTLNSRIKIVSTSFEGEMDITKPRRYSRDNSDIYKLKYDIMNNMDVVTNKKFDEVMFISNYVPFNIIHTWKDGYIGLVDTSGNTIIENDRFHNIEYIGYNNIYLVAEKVSSGYKWGVYKYGEGLTTGLDFDGFVTSNKGVPITHLYNKRDGGAVDYIILGNNGRVTNNVAEAFKLQKAIGIENVYKANVYGREYIIDSGFNLVSKNEKLNIEWENV